MDKNSDKEEKICPICSKNIRSDAAIHEYCKLCGMGIPKPFEAPKLQTDEGLAFFCCEKCYQIYVEKIHNKSQTSN